MNDKMIYFQICFVPACFCSQVVQSTQAPSYHTTHELPPHQTSLPTVSGGTVGELGLNSCNTVFLQFQRESPIPSLSGGHSKALCFLQCSCTYIRQSVLRCNAPLQRLPARQHQVLEWDEVSLRSATAYIHHKAAVQVLSSPAEYPRFQNTD